MWIYIIVILIILYFLNKKEPFDNLDNYIKSSNNGMWNLTVYNPYTDKTNFKDTFTLLFYNDTISNNDSLSSSEKTYLLKKDINKFIDQSYIKDNIIYLLNKYINKINEVTIISRQYTTMGIQYTYNVQLINNYDKLHYLKTKTKLKSLIKTILIDDLIKLEIASNYNITDFKINHNEDLNYINVEYNYIFVNILSQEYL